jgi:simple sugar transport system ATP-binding protein
MSEPLLRVEGISKAFGATEALHDVSFEVANGEVVALLGDNGAGKSTMIKVITGVFPPDRGRILFEGTEIHSPSPQLSRSLGIETVYQGAPLVDGISIYRNLFLGRESARRFGPFRVLSDRDMIRQSEEVLREIGIRVRDAEENVAILSGGERQAVSIGRCMHFGAKLLILDEPLNNLSLKETQVVLGHTQNARSKNVGVIFITHNIHQIFSVADRFVILEEGKKIADLRKEETDIDQLISVIAEGKYRASKVS